MGRQDRFPIAILGAGFGGIGAALALARAGIRSFTIFERGDAVGGTWRDNTYPGAACDVPSHLYSFSFAANPRWSRRYAPSAEIWRYLDDLVERWDLRSHLRLGTGIRGARYDDARGEWELSTDTGEAVRARWVISGVGGLVEPKLPEIEGLESFEGDLFHTGRWDHGKSLAGRRVAVIGTGASAVQVVPEVAKEASRLHVFQRTPGWVFPRLDRVYSEWEKRVFERVPGVLRTSRLLKYLRSELIGPRIYLDSERLSAPAERMSLRHLEAQVEDPALREKLRPDFQFGCKRILISDDYWASFGKPNVELVTEPIERVTPEGVLTRDGEQREVDALVLATGFELGIGGIPFPIAGRGGRRLEDAWKDGAVAYKGTSVSGFPNWSLLMGPNTGPGHTSVLIYTEAQIRHALRAIHLVRRENLRALDVRQDVQDAYDRKIQARMPRMVWGSGCSSWYLSPDGSNHSLYPGPAGEYALRTRRFRPADFEQIPFAR